MRDLTEDRIACWRVPHPFGDVPDDLLPYVGAFIVGSSKLQVIASRAGAPGMEGEVGSTWDHVSVSYPNQTPSWEDMHYIRNLFFLEQEPVMQLHPPSSVVYINNHPHCLHLWRPTETDIPLPPSVLVGYEELNPRRT